MIQFRVTSVDRRASSEVVTMHYTYDETGSQKAARQQGGEWEEVVFDLVADTMPPIGIDNVTGSVYLPRPPKLFVNNPKLFGLYKVGDIINFLPTRILEAEKTEVNAIVVPTLAPPTSG